MFCKNVAVIITRDVLFNPLMDVTRREVVIMEAKKNLDALIVFKTLSPQKVISSAPFKVSSQARSHAIEAP